ncbi:hypothetical protein CRG98_019092 [Punica granatum]|uniref:TIR domain-containing protein n=1 Tax=Punica granatum TaxID=22663 RepID=A0A2I0JW21_PUNGR|nr:hypothetical protein CRG98_019092 [Punica granatum]
MDVSSCSSKIYDVFLSFRGRDVRKSFADCLYRGLKDAGISVFRDEEALPVGEPIDPKLVQAIQQSKMSMPIFSRDYASSKSCLMEVQQMMECQGKGDHKILPIFFDVEPSVVKHQNDTFKISFTEHEQNGVDPETISMWKYALEKIGHLKGWDLQNFENGYHSKAIQGIISAVRGILKKPELRLPENLVGLDHNVEEVMRRLDVASNDVRIIVIHGIGGVGKTTLAKAVYNQLCHRFEACGHVDNIREASKEISGLRRLQRQLVSELLNKKLKFNSLDEGVRFMRERFSKTKVLILLDDLDNRKQLEFLGELNHYGPGSTIIVTTRKVILNLSYSQITRDIYSWTEIMKSTRKLKVLDLKACVNLSGCIEFPASMTLKVLTLEDCRRLRQIDPSIRYLKELESLNLKMCCEVANLPSELSFMTCLKELLIDGTSVSKLHFPNGSMKQLKTLSARGCKRLRETTDSIGGLKSLSHLALDDAIIEKLPRSIGELAKLESLSLRNCQNLLELPDSLGGSNELKVVPNLSNLVNLKELHLRLDATGYSSRLPQDFEWVSRLPKLEALQLSFTNHFELRLPGNFAGLSRLRKLTLIYVDLQHLPQLPSRLSRLSLQNCRSSSNSPDLSNMHGLLELELEHCEMANICGLHRLEALQVLRVSYCTVKTLEALEGLRHLRDLTIFHCSSLANLPDLSHFEMLQEKDIEYWNR